MDSFTILQKLETCSNFSSDEQISLFHIALDSEYEAAYNKPMPWIGIYIALASLICILAMVADLLHGFRSRKLWFPCKYFTLNAATLTVIAVGMKLPVDLNNLMPQYADRKTKVASLAFMCTMMANFLPSLATMGPKELLTNIIALDILVITLIVNVCIQIKTRVICPDLKYCDIISSEILFAIIYVAMLILLLILHTCSALTILKSKQILESKYKAGHETVLKDLELQQPGKLNVDKLTQLVSNYWIMAETGSPQFVTACSATTSASGVICFASTAMHVAFCATGTLKHHDSDYKWSIPIIFIIQFIGSLAGTIAPVSRCYAALSFKLSIKWIWNHIKVFKVESYWTQKLYDWKQSSMPFSVSSRKTKIVIQNFKVIFLTICIGVQNTIVVACKMIALIPILFVICVLFCIRSWKWLTAICSSSRNVKAQNSEQVETNNDLRQYVLQLQDDMELSERTLKRLSKSLNHLIQKAEKQPPRNLIKLLEVSKGFEGVGKYDSIHVPPLFGEEYLDCWSLPLVTLTSIVITLPKIQKHTVDRLLSSVSEGLTYVTLVEESINATDNYVRIQKAAKNLWLEVEVYHEWLGNNLTILPPPTYTAGQILQQLKNTAKNMVQNMNIGSLNDYSLHQSICANSMYRITETILLSYHTNIDKISQEDLFSELSSMIADILAACLTNLPQVIAMKCHESAIEKRESSVHTAAQLLGETTQIINNLQDRELPDLDPAELPFIDKWRDYFKYPSP